MNDARWVLMVTPDGYDDNSTEDIVMASKTEGQAKAEALAYIFDACDGEATGPLYLVMAEHDMSEAIAAEVTRRTRAKDDAAKAEAEAKERAEYERLRAKFGG